MSTEPELTPESTPPEEPPHSQPGPASSGTSTAPKRAIVIVLNIVIGALLVLTGYFGHSFFDRYFKKPVPIVRTAPAEEKPQPPKPSTVIQVDILNGSGEKGIAARFTNFLRARGYDVVEMKNYKISNVPHTLVIDRLGNLKPARDIAQLLGVPDSCAMQQLNPDYFVDVSVVIGDDCYELNPSKEQQ